MMNKQHLFWLCLLAAFSSRAEITDAQIDADCAKISDYARDGARLYKAKQYDKARDSFVQQVAWQEQCSNEDSDLIATAYNNVALTWIRQGDYRKARAWLQIAPQDKKSQYNLSLIADKLRSMSEPTSAAGEYWQYSGRGNWDTLNLSLLKKGEYQAKWSGYYFGLMSMYYGPNIGEFEEKVALKRGKGSIILNGAGDDTCTISLTLSADQEHLDIDTDSPENCGFGHNVSASGRYVRIN